MKGTGTEQYWKQNFDKQWEFVEMQELSAGNGK
jgi:hypothetical protein